VRHHNGRKGRVKDFHAGRCLRKGIHSGRGGKGAEFTEGYARVLRPDGSVLEERGGHETENENEKREEGRAATVGVERLRIVNGKGAKKANAEEQGSPDVPAHPELEIAEDDETKGEKQRGIAMRARTYRAQDMAAIELSGRQKIEGGGEEADPSGASYGVEQEIAGGDSGMKNGGEKMKNERRAEDELGVSRVRQAGDKLSVEDAVN